MTKRIAIIGRGVSGLCCGVRLLEAGYSVDIYSRDELAKTTSMAAGAYWWPHKAYPLDRVSAWSRVAFEEYKLLQRDPNSGISFQQHFRFCKIPDDSISSVKELDEWQRIDGAQFGVECAEAFRLVTPLIDVPIFMPYLEQRFLRAGGNIFHKEFHSPEELFPSYQLVVNCSGVWARFLVNDARVFPIRGQVLQVSRPTGLSDSIRVVQTGDDFVMILPRTRDCVLGGTTEKDNWSLEPSEETTKKILENCQQVQPLLKDVKVIRTVVGLRPGRDAIRLELEEATPGRPIVHNYGHGGGGFTVAWGCAAEVRDLVVSHLR